MVVARLAADLFAQVDYVGIAAFVAPIVIGLLGVAWRLGALDSKVKDVKEDVSEVKQDVRELRQIAGFQPREGRR